MIFLTNFSLNRAEPFANEPECQISLGRQPDALRIVPCDLKRIARVTGKSLSGETLLNPNESNQGYGVAGTDLHIVWDMGKGKTGYFFKILTVIWKKV